MRYRIEEYADRAMPASDGKWVKWNTARTLAHFTACYITDNAKRSSQSKWCWWYIAPQDLGLLDAAITLVDGGLWIQHADNKNLFRPKGQV